jgi:hydrogenase expression/formation protein HypD
MLNDVFDITDRAWRGIGVIPQSGWQLAEKYRYYDAEARFDVGRHPHRRVGDLSLR